MKKITIVSFQGFSKGFVLATVKDEADKQHSVKIEAATIGEVAVGAVLELAEGLDLTATQELTLKSSTLAAYTQPNAGSKNRAGAGCLEDVRKHRAM